MRFLTAGESHGKALVVILEGLPAGLRVEAGVIDRALARRQKGIGRGARQKIERDRVEILSGVRGGVTLGSPVALEIRNNDWENWSGVMDPAPAEERRGRELTLPRPGHADLAGALKMNTHDARDILERASARETAARVAAGAVAGALLREFGAMTASCVLAIGRSRVASNPSFEEMAELDEDLPMPGADAAATAREAIEEARREGDTLGGAVLVAARGLVPGLGSHAQWDRRLDAKLGAALLSIPSVKAVEFGDGIAASASSGSEVQDPIFHEEGRGFYRTSNHAGGLEGGITNGEELRATLYLKPLPTLMKPLPSADLVTKKASPAQKERSDTCAVVPAAVISEALACLVLAGAYLEKFGGDSLGETLRNLEGYRRQLMEY